MQLKYYLAIIRRFWPLVVALPILVGAISLVAVLREPTRYTAEANMMIMQQRPDLTSTPSPTELRDQWGGTDYVVDDLPGVIGSTTFAQDVSATLQARGITLAPAAVQSSLSMASLHRSVTIMGTAATPELAQSLVNAAVDTLRTNGLNYWGWSTGHSGPGMNVTELSPPDGATPSRSARRVLTNVGVRSALGLAAGIGLAFLLHYLDSTVRDAQQVESGVGLRVVGAIPPQADVRKRIVSSKRAPAEGSRQKTASDL